jgi:hypothetical protein
MYQAKSTSALTIDVGIFVGVTGTLAMGVRILDVLDVVDDVCCQDELLLIPVA